MRHSPLSAVLLMGLVAACGKPPEGPELYIQDDLDGTLFEGKKDRLEVPYVRGAEVTLYVNSAGAEDADFSDWTLRSTDDTVFEVLEVDARADDLNVEGLATGAGEAELEVLDATGQVVHSVSVEVGFPDSVELTPHVVSYVPELADTFADEAPRVLQGHVATFEVTYFQGAERLHGNGVLTTAADASLHVESDVSNLFEDREWLRINPSTSGTHTVTIEVDGTELGSLEVDAVDPDELTHISLETESVVGATTGDSRHVVALGFDADGAPVLGVNPSWELGSEPTTDPGDLYVYGRFGEVASSNRVGCTSAPLAAPALLWLAGLLGVRRRGAGQPPATP